MPTPSHDNPKARSRSEPIAALVLILFAVLMLYTGGYLLSGEVGGSVALGDTVKIRTFKSRAEAIVYAPAAKIESAITGTSVWLAHYLE